MAFEAGDKVKMGTRAGKVVEVRGDGNSVVVEFEDGGRSEVAHTALVAAK